MGLEAHELTELAVGMIPGVILVPSTLTSATPVVLLPHDPLGTYDTTFLPVTSTESELDG